MAAPSRSSSQFEVERLRQRVFGNELFKQNLIRKQERLRTTSDDVPKDTSGGHKRIHVPVTESRGTILNHVREMNQRPVPPAQRTHALESQGYTEQVALRRNQQSHDVTQRRLYEGKVDFAVGPRPRECRNKTLGTSHPSMFSATTSAAVPHGYLPNIHSRGLTTSLW
mmetsp:Transcript_57685/g.103078  ORF Transcript_57685/g.103078 Transcript_57685/m.103078 type:complete len:168 (-) Transcript_57685:1815-2318(-)